MKKEEAATTEAPVIRESMAEPAEHIVFFDGECLFCNRGVRFLMRIDRKRVLTYATLQGKAARSLPDSLQHLTTIVFSKNGSLHTKSTAIVHILISIGGLWQWMGWMLRLVPRPIRDAIYDWIAKNRYRWFGKRPDACSLLPPEEQARLLD